jgi:hypothetical protein
MHSARRASPTDGQLVQRALAQHLDLAGAGRHARCEDGLYAKDLEEVLAERPDALD